LRQSTVVSGPWCRKVRAELEVGDIQADVLYGADPLIYMMLRGAGQLLPYSSPETAAVKPEYRTGEENFTLANGRYAVIVWSKGGAIAIPRPVAIVQDTAHSEESTMLAKEFMNFVLSAQGQGIAAKFGFVPVRTDVPAPKGIPAEFKIVMPDWDWMHHNDQALRSKRESIMHGEWSKREWGRGNLPPLMFCADGIMIVGRRRGAEPQAIAMGIAGISLLLFVAYPLKVKQFSKGETCRRVEEILALVHLEGLGRRCPHELSGGQQQRAALTRALVMEPRLLLLDEPLSNLDARLREELREELKRIQREIEITMIYVTHDQAEAMAIADRIALMERGRLIQIGPPRELYEHPKTEFVARFIGVTNLFSCRVMEAEGRKVFLLPNGAAAEVGDLDGLSEGTVVLSVRSEDIVLSHDGGGVEGKIKEVVYLGNLVYYRLSDGGVDLRVQAVPGKPFKARERVYFHIRRAIAIN